MSKTNKKAFILGARGLAAAAAAAVTLSPIQHATAQGGDNDPAQVWDAFGGNQQCVQINFADATLAHACRSLMASARRP